MDRQLFLAGHWHESSGQLTVADKATEEPIAIACLAETKHYEQAMGHAVHLFETSRQLPTWQRQTALRHIAARLEEEREGIATTLCREAGKPIRYALGEVDRAVLTFRFAAETLLHWQGDIIPLDISPASTQKLGFVRRFPIGPVLGISPFNFPLNLAAHKIAPALAVGNPIILKPASSTPLSAFYLADFIAETNLPQGMLQVLPARRKVVDTIIGDERLAMLSFTGSAEVGWRLKARAGKAKVALELGGNAGLYIAADANIDDAVARALVGAFAYSGQVCISVQRIFLHAQIATDFRQKFVEAVGRLRMGDPLDPATEIGPMIDLDNAIRLADWIAEARRQGAKLLCGGTHTGSVFMPTVMENVPLSCPLQSEEAFGPVVNLQVVNSDSEALEQINQSRFGLQAGIFSNNMSLILRAFEEIEAGGIIVNDVPTFRVDNMPYGGVKDSGFGREGIAYTMAEMSELKHLAIGRS
jgi:acyl-CoA reductase-like NAD-dependent aldehyde dehydrogenase